MSVLHNAERKAKVVSSANLGAFKDQAPIPIIVDTSGIPYIADRRDRVIPLADAVNVRTYGAKGDGVTDDTAAIQVSIDVVNTAGGGSVYLPTGIYVVTSTITLYRFITLLGTGWGTIIQSTAANPIIQLSADAADAEVRGCFIDNLQINGVAVGNGLTGLRVVRWGTGGSPTARACAFSRLRIRNCSVGIRFVDSQGIALRDSKIDSNTTGVYASDNSQLGVLQNVDIRANVTGMRMEASNTIIGGSADAIYGWTLNQVHFEANTGKGLVLDGATTNTFLNCKWEANDGTFLEVVNTVSGIRCDLNNFLGGIFNGSATTPTVLQVDLQSSSGTIFQGVVFNSGSNSGINIASGGWRTVFFQCSNNSTITDAAAANVGTSHINNTSSLFSLGRATKTLTDAATIVVDASANDHFKVTLGGNRAMGAPTGSKDGQRITFVIVQDGTGSRSLTWNATYKQAWSDTGNVAGARSSISFVFDGTNWNQDGAQSPYI